MSVIAHVHDYIIHDTVINIFRNKPIRIDGVRVESTRASIVFLLHSSISSNTNFPFRRLVVLTRSTFLFLASFSFVNCPNRLQSMEYIFWIKPKLFITIVVIRTLLHLNVLKRIRNNLSKTLFNLSVLKMLCTVPLINAI